MELLMIILIMLFLYIFSSSYLQYDELKNEFNFQIKDCFKINKENVLVFVQILLLGIFGYCMFADLNLDYTGLYKYVIVITIIFLAVIIDIKKRIIPNKLCVILLLVVMLFDCYQIFLQLENAKVFSLSFLFGGGIAFVIFFISMLISRGGIGAGDVKLITIIGLCVGSTNILNVIFYTLLASFIYSIVMLVLRKVKLKDFIAMAPFIYIGMLANFVISLI
ncbi:prepilin peptidase [Thomasclavelia saccharogumia]|uniref:prepilin peptidase n=1 Tax=Thomasclavelia saccharogumia TaxID=341225 RepID=UPI0004791133|nr:prepilin peptidase [Thomasclavelia saccharogumia]